MWFGFVWECRIKIMELFEMLVVLELVKWYLGEIL